MIPEDKIAEIRKRAPIAEIVGDYVNLKKSGTSLKGLCPFHSEKTPSFVVHPRRGFYHCFGCQASGDVFSFLMQVEAKTFPEVARELAERTGVQLPSYDPEREGERQRGKRRIERFARLMDAACDFFAGQLRDHLDATIPQAMLAERGIDRTSIEAFRLGYAPHGWDGLLRFLERGGWSPEDAERVGLIASRRSGRGHYDRFRHRLMFPITDLQGRVVAFSGRALPAAPSMDAARETPPKYVNSPESPLYRKGQVLYGLYEGRVAVRREEVAVLCEGNFDLVSLHQAGFANAVAPMGTALTEDHAKLLRRFAPTVVLLFDGDEAGRKAVREAYGLLQKVGVNAQVATLPEGTDPDSFLRKSGAEALRARLSKAPTATEFLIDDAAARAGSNTHSKANAIMSLGPILARVESPIERHAYVERIARKFEVNDIDLVKRELRRGIGGARKQTSRSRDALQQKAIDSVPKLQLKLISVLIDQPTLITEKHAEKLAKLLTSQDLRAIFDSILRMVDRHGSLDATALLADLQANPLRSWVEAKLAVEEHSLADARTILVDGVPRLEQQNIERELPKLQQRIVEAGRTGDEALAAGLRREFVELTRWAHKLKQASTKQR